VTIQGFVWTDDRIDHVARHGVEIEEFEEVCFGRAMAVRVEARGKNPVYEVLGRTDAGRYLVCVVILFPDATGFPITARPMTAKEKRRFERWSRR
jgi:uncharacterized DUF497 family protein